MKRRHWFLPDAPDVLGVLGQQAAITVEGIDELVAWANGEAGANDRLRECEHRADDRKRELREELTSAFTTPLASEDIFELSRGLDEVLNSAKNTVREAEVMETGPNAAIAEMAGHLAEGTRHVAEAFATLEHPSVLSTDPADKAVKCQRHVEHVYREAMSSLVDVDDLREVSARRELYRRLVRTSEELAYVGQRVWYSVLKES